MRGFTVCAPMSFVGTGRVIEYDDSAVAIAVSDIKFIRVLIDRKSSWASEVIGVVASATLPGATDLEDELTVGGKF